MEDEKFGMSFINMDIKREWTISTADLPLHKHFFSKHGMKTYFKPALTTKKAGCITLWKQGRELKEEGREAKFENENSCTIGYKQDVGDKNQQS